MQRALSAPSKLFLSGEYSVLWGGTARVAAVGPRTAALVERRGDREVHLVLESGRLVGTGTPFGVRWPGEVPRPFLFAARAIDAVWRAHARESLGFSLALSPSPDAPDGRKLGLGGSARACLLATEATRFILEERLDSLKLALLSHAQTQGLKGSGGDVAAIFAGGIVRYRRYPVETLAPATTTGQLNAALAQAEPVDLWRLPEPRVLLSYAFVGESASTQSQISRVEEQLDEAGRDRFVRRSDELGAQLEDALNGGDFPSLREATQGLHELLCTLGPVDTEPMRRLLALARAQGAAGKVSGAGGGDGCVLFSQEEDERARMLQALTSRGYLAFPLTIEPGLRGESVAESRLAAWLSA